MIAGKVQELAELSPKLNVLFEKFKSFYGSSWDKTIPFNLTVYPILGNRGQTTATPHANSLEMGILTQEDDNFTLLSVGMHEMCHVLYDEQSLQMQEMIDRQPDAAREDLAFGGLGGEGEVVVGVFTLEVGGGVGPGHG